MNMVTLLMQSAARVLLLISPPSKRRALEKLYVQYTYMISWLLHVCALWQTSSTNDFLQQGLGLGLVFGLGLMLVSAVLCAFLSIFNLESVSGVGAKVN